MRFLGEEAKYKQQTEQSAEMAGKQVGPSVLSRFRVLNLPQRVRAIASLCSEDVTGLLGEGTLRCQQEEQSDELVGRALGRLLEQRQGPDGYKRMSRAVKHVRFDASKGYPGEGPDTLMEEECMMQKALDQAAIAAAEEDAGRELHDPYCVQRTAGNKRRRFVLEAEDSGDEGAERLQDIVGDQERVDCA